MTRAAPLAFVSLVGAGPGDPGLLTLRGLEALRRADVVLHDYLSAPELLLHCPQARVQDVGKKGFAQATRQEDINALLVREALSDEGQRVVRLKGGDPFVFGRGGEEALACASAGIPFEVIPGVSSALAAPAYAGIPVTHRKLARSFAVLTGRTEQGAAYYGQLGGIDTLVFLMGVHDLEGLTADLLRAGRSPNTPAACVQWASTPHQRQVVTTLGNLAHDVRAAGLGAPAVTVVGEVARLGETLGWFTPPPVTAPPVTAPPEGRLQGRRVAVTRTREQASRLVELLRREGASVLEVPLITFARSAEPEAVRLRLSDLSGIDWLLLTSPQAVTALFTELGGLGLDARALSGMKLAAVGPSTAQALNTFGLRADSVPAQAGARHLAAELPARAGVRALHLTSQLAEDALQSGLQARGISYERLELYRTVPAELSAAQNAALQSAEAVTLASGSAASHLAALGYTHLPVAVMGPQTVQAAKQAGFVRVVQAHTVSLEGLVEAVVELLAGERLEE